MAGTAMLLAEIADEREEHFHSHFERRVSEVEAVAVQRRIRAVAVGGLNAHEEEAAGDFFKVV
jgi:hypothetical protein